MDADFTITVRCTSCGEGRPVSQDPCPSCGADAYRHRTADAGEVLEMADDGAVGDGDSAPFE